MENELSRAVDVIPGLVWTARPDGHVDHVNRGWCEYTGGTLGDAAGQGWLDAVHPDDQPELRDRWHAILASRQPRDMSARLRRFDGAWRQFVLRVSPVTDGGGKLTQWLGMACDIEDHRQATGAPLSFVGDFAAMADAIPASLLLMTPDGEIEYSNRRSQEFRGATLEQQRGWKSSDLIHPDDLPAVVAGWEHCVETGNLFQMEFRCRRADGVYHWFHVFSQPMRDATGRIERWCTLDVDIDDQKRGEALLASTLDELAKSENRMRALIDTVPGFVWRATPTGEVEFINQRWCDYTGLSLQDSLGHGWTSRIHPEDALPLGGYWQALLDAGKPGSFEARLRHVDGSYRWFLIRAVPLLDEAGRVVNWYGQNTEIDDRKRAELLLAGEKHLLGLVAGGAPLAQVLASLCELAQASLDDALCSVVLVDPGRPRSSLEPSRRLRLQPGAAPDVPADLLQDTDGRPLGPDASPVALAATCDVAVFATDVAEDTRWEAWRPIALAHGIRAHWSTPVKSSAGDVMGVLSILFREPRTPERTHHNLMAQFTQLASIAIERSRSEAALRQSEAFLARTQRLTLTGTVAWRVTTDEILWSEELYRIYEFDPGVTLTHDLINTRIHPEDIPAHDEMLRQQRLEARDFESEHRLLMPDGQVKFLHLVAHMTHDEEGGLAYISAVQDITHRRLAEEALGKARAELAHVARVATLGALTASIAHEVNQPLAGIITNANTCLRMLGADPPNVAGARETARRTIRDGNRASDVIKRLRAMFAKKGMTTERVDLNEAAREVIAMLLGELQRGGVILHPDFADDLPPIRGDRVQLQQVILNLIMNASDAMSEVTDRPRQMRIRTSRDEGARVRLTVSDSGTGFDPHDAERLFHAFYTTKSAGMGMGLSVSRSIIEGHDGRLWAAPNDDCGATFAFSLPHPADSGFAAPGADIVHPGRNVDPDHVLESY
jgi:PAS domain S-box-containing protein